MSSTGKSSREPPFRVVVMGVAGSGKSTVGRALALRTGARFLEGDDFHSPASIEKMSAGIPLTDEDRWPWLARLREAMRAEQRVVLACSALRRSHRDVLRGAGDVRFIDLVLAPPEARARLQRRSEHYMAPSMVASQFETLEDPTTEADVAVVSALGDIDRVVERAIDALAVLRPSSA